MKDYLYDGSFDGLLTAIFYAYSSNETSQILKEKYYVPSLFTEAISITTESDKADRVYKGLENKLSSSTLSNVYYLYLSDREDVGTLILQYIKLCFKYSDSINLAKNNDIIRQVDQYVRRVSLEAHRFIGFVRFKEVSPLFFYAPIEPDHNILPLIMHHFTERFSDQHFIIHDLKRNTAIFYNQKEAFLQQLLEEEAKKLLSCNIKDPFETLFKSFYEASTISARINEKRRNAFLPKRYFKHLVEI